MSGRRSVSTAGRRGVIIDAAAVVLGGLVFAGAACSASTGSDRRTQAAPVATGGLDSTSEPTASGGDDDPLTGGGGLPMAGSPVTSDGVMTDTTSDGCGTTVSAPVVSGGVVDIVWVVDASGSMSDEQAFIGENLTKFANDISGSAVDARIVMLTQEAGITIICNGDSIGVDPGGPDSEGADPIADTALHGDPRYAFLYTEVDSHNALDIALDQFGRYEDLLRPDAPTHFVFVTDDESEYRWLPTPQQRAAAFQADMTARLGHPFFAHTISSPGPAPCVPEVCQPPVFEDCGNGSNISINGNNCGAAAPGDTYWELARTTNSLTASICQEDWSAIFAPLTQAIIESVPLPCSFTVPDSPAGTTFNADRVNVAFTPAGSGADAVWPRADSVEACADHLAWYFAGPSAAPGEVRLCPAACDRAQFGGTIDLSFGCEAVLLE